MPVFLQMRFAGMQLACALRRSMIRQGDGWTIDADRQGRPILSAGPVRVLLVPRPMRLFDAVHLYCDDAEIWLPVGARVRLRNTARLLLLRRAYDQCVEAGLMSEEPAEKKRATRTRRRNAQTA